MADARFAELALLTQLDQLGQVTVTPKEQAVKDLLIYLLEERMVNHMHLSGVLPAGGFGGPSGEMNYRHYLHERPKDAIFQVLEGSTLELHLAHRGRLRLSELKQQLRSGRDREPFGILWDTRHWEQDLAMSLLEAGSESPVSVAYMDMNGLKRINDTYSHDAGDQALRAYFQAVSSAVGDRGQVFRLGGDEVLAVLPDSSIVEAEKMVRAACTRLMAEEILPDGQPSYLSISCGIASCTDPKMTAKALRRQVDLLQKQAKQRSKVFSTRPSTIAREGSDVIEIPFDFTPAEQTPSG